MFIIFILGVSISQLWLVFADFDKIKPNLTSAETELKQVQFESRGSMTFTTMSKLEAQKHTVIFAKFLLTAEMQGSNSQNQLNVI